MKSVKLSLAKLTTPGETKMENTFLPKWMLQTLGVLLIILIAVLILNQLGRMSGPPQIMSVSAEGKVTAVPDLATVTIGVASQGANPIDVKNKNNDKINQIIAFIKQQDIDSTDIQTTAFYASPLYNYANGQNTLTGYQAEQAVTVKVHGVDKSQDKLEKILDGAVTNGANEIQGVDFTFTDSDKLKQAARKQAIENAKNKAHELASEADLTLGRVVNVIESPSNFYRPMPLAANFGVRAKSISPTIEPGNQEITESVTLVFEVS